MMGIGLLLSQGALRRTPAGSGFSDNFNRADNSSSLGTPSGGGTWNVVSGTFGISGNKGYVAVAGSPARCWAETSLADATWLGKLSGDGATPDYAAFLFRYSDANNYWAVESHGANGAVKLYKYVGGAQSDIPGVTAIGSTTLADIKVVTLGSSITLYTGGGSTLLGSTTDSFNATATKVGFLSYGTNQKVDDFAVS